MPRFEETVTRSFEIEQGAEQVLKSQLPKSWLFRKQTPDFHIDYDIEIVENSSLTGIVFSAQLKGTEHIKDEINFIRHSMSSKHLTYYLNKVKSKPVFLFIVDNKKEKIYWLFIQRYLKDEIKNKNWLKQKSVTIYIDKNNIISDIDDFKKIILDADNYIRELWPSTVRASVNKEKEQFKKLDPRFDVEIIAKGENVSYKFHTDEKLDIKFQIKDQKMLEKIFSEPNDGRTIKVPSDVIEVTGSDLLKDRLSVSDYIEFKLLPPPLKADVYLSRLGGEHNQAELVHLSSKLSFQKEFLKIQSSLIDSPLTIECIFYFAINSKPSFNINFDFTNWINKPIKLLPYAEKLVSLFKDQTEDETLTYKAEINGEQLLLGTFIIHNNQNFENYTNSILTLYTRLKYLENIYNLNLIFPDLSKLKRTHYNDIEEGN